MKCSRFELYVPANFDNSCILNETQILRNKHLNVVLSLLNSFDLDNSPGLDHIKCPIKYISKLMSFLIIETRHKYYTIKFGEKTQSSHNCITTLPDFVWGPERKLLNPLFCLTNKLIPRKLR